MNFFICENFLITWPWQCHRIFLGQDKIGVLAMGFSHLKEALTSGKIKYKGDKPFNKFR